MEHSVPPPPPFPGSATPANAFGALPDYPIPSRGKRFLAFVIDLVIAAFPLTVTSILILTPIFAMMAYRPLPPILGNQSVYLVAIVVFYLAIPWFLFYSLCRDGFRGGQSLGKRLCGLKVITLEDGRSCTMNKSLVRNTLLTLILSFQWMIPLFGLLAVLVEPITVLRSPRGWRYGDRRAGTQVVEVGSLRIC